MSYFMPEAKPFHYCRGPNSALLIHGFTGSPGEMKPLGVHLAEKNISVKAPLLPGHGTKPGKMTKTTYKDWLDLIYKEIEFMLSNYERTTLIGLSMGGLLSLAGAIKYPVENVVSMAAPINLTYRFYSFVPLISRLNLYIPKGKWDSFVKERGAYNCIPTKSLSDLLNIRNFVKEGISSINCPVLIMQGKKDLMVSQKSPLFLNEHIKDSRLVMFSNSGHILTMDKEREKVLNNIEHFIFGKHISL